MFIRIISESVKAQAPLRIGRDDGAEVRLVGVPSQPVQVSMAVQAQRAFAITQDPVAVVRNAQAARARIALQQHRARTA